MICELFTICLYITVSEKAQSPPEIWAQETLSEYPNVL